jgi:hypothetical protein
MNTWFVSQETGGRQVSPVRVHFQDGDRVAILLDVRRPGATAVLSERVWCLSGQASGAGVLYRTVSTSRAGTQGMMLLRGTRVIDEGRTAENRTIAIIRDLLDLDVLNASDSRGTAFTVGHHDGSCA